MSSSTNRSILASGLDLGCANSGSALTSDSGLTGDESLYKDVLLSADSNDCVLLESGLIVFKKLLELKKRRWTIESLSTVAFTIGGSKKRLLALPANMSFKSEGLVKRSRICLGKNGFSVVRSTELPEELLED